MESLTVGGVRVAGTEPDGHPAEGTRSRRSTYGETPSRTVLGGPITEYRGSCPDRTTSGLSVQPVSWGPRTEQ